ncbi:MAG: hypothetical protein ACRCUY_08595, partial [Thermoguttaceae bacterium]
MLKILTKPTPFVLIVWFAFLGMYGYYFLIDYWHTPHPSYIPLFTLVAIQVIALLAATIFGVLRLVFGPERLKTIAWLLLACLPGFLWYSLISLSFQTLEERLSRQVEAT